MDATRFKLLFNCVNREMRAGIALCRLIATSFLLAVLAACGGGSGNQFECSQVQSRDSLVLSPNEIATGSPGARIQVTLHNTVDGDVFYGSNTILWNGSDAGIQMTYVDQSTLEMTVPSELLANAGAAQIAVQGSCSQTGPTQSQSAPFTITSNPSPVSISTRSPLLSTAVGARYSETFAASGGTPPYRWSLASAVNTLPPGMNLSANGVLSGSPSASGSFTFVVQVTDSASQTANATSQSFSISVLSQPVGVQALAVQTNSLPGAAQGKAYSFALQASGGRLPYNWTVIGGSLPAGMSLSSVGELKGTPMESGSFNFSVKVSDASASSLTDTKALSLDVGVGGIAYAGTGSVLYPSQRTLQNLPPLVALDDNADTAVIVWTSTDPNQPGEATLLAKGSNGIWASTSNLAPLAVPLAFQAAISGDGSTVAVTSAACGSIGVPNCVVVIQRPTTSSGWLDLPVNADIFTLRQAQPQSGDNFGASLAISYNGDTIAVGAPCASTGGACGSVYVFKRPCASWSRNCNNGLPTENETAQLSVAVNAGGFLAPVATLGFSVSIDDVGHAIVAGAPDVALGTTAGSAYVFQMPINGWTTTSAATTNLFSSDGKGGDQFGWSVAISSDGGTVAVGARKNPETGSPPDGPGAAYVFAPSRGWSSSSTLHEDAELKASLGQNNDGFGESVAVATGGSTVVVGAPNNPFVNGQPGHGTAYVFREPMSGGWSGAPQPLHEAQTLTAYAGSIVGSNVPTVPSSYFGATGGLSLTRDGSTIAVGGVANLLNGPTPEPVAVVYLFQ
jgi:hypothetical protein